MRAAFDPEKVARYVVAEHERRADYRNLPMEIAPTNIAQAYAAQLALVRLLGTRKGKVAGLKIATTTKIMQQLMGIDHPCGGTIFEKTVHASPAKLRLSDYQHVVIECELAVRLARDLPAASAPYLVANGISVEGLNEAKRVFSGTAREAAAGFPANVNVAAALSLAGIGPDRTMIDIWADPAVTRNCHTIEVDADSARFTLSIENVTSEENPKTGKIVALSVIAALRKMHAPLAVGT